jgi:mono/diheme cytochrome c family protein
MIGARAGELSRGRYLAILGDCAGCHTYAHGPAYSGGRPMHAIFGTVYSVNITPDKATGIGGWTSAQFYRALHEGIAADGHHLYPAFPYFYFAKMSRADSDAIFTYLKTLKPVHRPPTPNALIFPTDLRIMMAGWDLLFLDKSPFKPDPKKSAEWNRGAFIVNGPGHCAACHTPKNIFFADKSSEAFRGTTVDGWFAANLTASPRDGMGQWTKAEIVQYLKTGLNRHARAAGAMQEVIMDSTSKMTNSDIAAIATYLKSLPAAPTQTPKPPSRADMQAGHIIFIQRCAACHTAPDQPHPRDYPLLAHNTMVQARDPTSVLAVILGGAESASTANGPVGFSMPAFTYLSDKEVAQVTTYIRNSWGNKADPATAAQAASARQNIR